MVRAAALAMAVLLAAPFAGFSPAQAEGENSIAEMKRKKKVIGASDPLVATPAWHGSATSGKATTETEIVANDTHGPMLSVDSAAALQAAESKYAAIVSAGGWPSIQGGKLKKGSQGKAVEALNKRLYIEGYVRAEAAQGEFAAVFTSATEEALRRFQRNHGLAVTGALDQATLAALNVPAGRRLATIRANIARMQEYSKDIGNRYVVVNVPAQQIEAVNDGRVYSRHNAIVGRPSRPTPVVMTALVDIKFNPYWNAPASIVERDIIPRMLSGGSSKVLNDMRIKVFDGVGGPEIDPDRINWRRAIPDNYHFRQEPGGENAMATAKIEFNSPFGIYLHDTPEKHLFATGQRLYSSGCVRVEKVAVLLNWILNGQDGIDAARIAELARTEERLDVKLVNPPQLRVTYLTAWTNRQGEVNFRSDVYELDGTGFVVGQPLPVGETSGGQRFVLKPVPRQLASVDAAEAEGFFWFGSRPRKSTADATKRGSSTSLSRMLRNPDGNDSVGLFWSEDSAPVKKKPVKKLANKGEDDKRKKKPLAKKDEKAKSGALAKADEKAPVKKKIVKKDEQAAAAKKVEPTTKKNEPAKRPDDKCKADKDGKLPKDCKPVAQVKPTPKPGTTASATN
jgi:murein L,D-transpeptidase YcbB/YkuD